MPRRCRTAGNPSARCPAACARSRAPELDLTVARRGLLCAAVCASVCDCARLCTIVHGCVQLSPPFQEPSDQGQEELEEAGGCSADREERPPRARPSRGAAWWWGAERRPHLQGRTELARASPPSGAVCPSPPISLLSQSAVSPSPASPSALPPPSVLAALRELPWGAGDAGCPPCVSRAGGLVSPRLGKPRWAEPLAAPPQRPRVWQHCGGSRGALRSSCPAGTRGPCRDPAAAPRSPRVRAGGPSAQIPLGRCSTRRWAGARVLPKRRAVVLRVPGRSRGRRRGDVGTPPQGCGLAGGDGPARGTTSSAPSPSASPCSSASEASCIPS
ncbi:dapper homolog 3-like [Apteryx rowi]|uniref:dapper homolog 3-like n=1 Tax=Apteryx rowi TaxID=308060 RepID=UPI000E1DFBE1|nr:dapper homolog 3-like [Apteryx rowi]